MVQIIRNLRGDPSYPTRLCFQMEEQIYFILMQSIHMLGVKRDTFARGPVAEGWLTLIDFENSVNRFGVNTPSMY